MGLSLKVFGVKYFFCLCVYFFGRFVEDLCGPGLGCIFPPKSMEA